MFGRKRLSIKVKAWAFFVPLVIMSAVMVLFAFVPLERARTRLEGTRQVISATFEAERFRRTRVEKVLAATNFVMTADTRFEKSYFVHERSSVDAMDRWIEFEDEPAERRATIAMRQEILKTANRVDVLFALVESGQKAKAAAMLAEMLTAFDGTSFALEPMLKQEHADMRDAFLQLAGQAGAASGLLGTELTTHVTDAHGEVEQMLSVSNFMNLSAIEGVYLARGVVGIDGFSVAAAAVGSFVDGELATWSRMHASHPATPAAHDELNGIVRHAPAVDRAVERILAQMKLGDTAAAQDIYLTRYLPILEADLSGAEATLAGHEREVEATRNLVLTDGRNAQVWRMALASALFLMALGALVIARRATKRLVALNATADRFSEGDLTARTPTHANDELGHLAVRLNEMAGRLEKERARAGLLLERTVESGEHERTQLAADLHDGPVQRLTAVLYGLERAVLRLGRGEIEGLEDSMVDAKEKVGNEVRAIRNMMSELRPPILDERGLEPAISDYTAGFAKTSDVVMDVDLSVDDRLIPSLETTMYRVMQEALTNIGKHAKASHVGVKAWSENGNVMLRVVDDGVGFDPAAQTIGDTDHYGLTGMLERTRLAGGECHFESSPGNGTTVTATFPQRKVVAE